MPDLAPPLRWTKLAGGHSNFTYRIDDAAGLTMVARRPPLGELLPTAHDMGREFRVISALWPTPVPVPEPVAYTDDVAVTGAQFYVMGWVEGRSLYTAEETAEHIPTEEARQRTGPSFIDTLAALHGLDPGTPSASATSASRRTTSAASCTGGTSRGTRRRTATSPTSTACTRSSSSASPSRPR